MTTHAQMKLQDGEELVREYLVTRSPQAKERAIKAFLPLVKHIVGRLRIYENGTLRREDIYQFGVVGLLTALERFRPEYGVIFKTFAYKRIYGEIIDAMRREGLLNKEQIRIQKMLALTGEKLRAEFGREPTAKEIYEQAGVSEERYDQIQELLEASYTLSLDDGVAADENESILRKDTIVDEDQIPPDVALDLAGIKEELKSIVQDLPERQRLILALYFYEELTLYDIGQVLSISESRVSQILNSTLKEIRAKLNY